MQTYATMQQQWTYITRSFGLSKGSAMQSRWDRWSLHFRLAGPNQLIFWWASGWWNCPWAGSFPEQHAEKAWQRSRYMGDRYPWQPCSNPGQKKNQKQEKQQCDFRRSKLSQDLFIWHRSDMDRLTLDCCPLLLVLDLFCLNLLKKTCTCKVVRLEVRKKTQKKQHATKNRTTIC